MNRDQFLKIITPPLFVFLSSVALTAGLSAQQYVGASSGETRQESTRTDIQTFDKRLPPVLPGAEVYHNGKKIRVITTSGPVPVNPAPQAPRHPTNRRFNPDNISVIVDERGDNQAGRLEPQQSAQGQEGAISLGDDRISAQESSR